MKSFYIGKKEVARIFNKSASTITRWSKEIQDFPILDKLINTYHIPFYWITSSNKIEKYLKWNFISFYWFLSRHKVQRIIFVLDFSYPGI